MLRWYRIGYGNWILSIVCDRIEIIAWKNRLKCHASDAPWSYTLRAFYCLFSPKLRHSVGWFFCSLVCSLGFVSMLRSQMIPSMLSSASPARSTTSTPYRTQAVPVKNVLHQGQKALKWDGRIYRNTWQNVLLRLKSQLCSSYTYRG